MLQPTAGSREGGWQVDEPTSPRASAGGTSPGSQSLDEMEGNPRPPRASTGWTSPPGPPGVDKPPRASGWTSPGPQSLHRVDEPQSLHEVEEFQAPQSLHRGGQAPSTRASAGLLDPRSQPERPPCHLREEQTLRRHVPGAGLGDTSWQI